MPYICRAILSLALVTCYFCCTGCIKPKITLFPDRTEPLEEYRIQGQGEGKILLVPVKGFISDNPGGLLWKRQGMVQEVVSQLRKAEKDKNIKAVILRVDSPGGSVTASDMLFHEIKRYKESTGARIVTEMMSVAASGGYYISLPSDMVMAHSTAITGSVGVVFIRPKVKGLMGKIGVDIEVEKSGKNKDMGSPFRDSTEEEHQILQNLIHGFSEKFMGLVTSHRSLTNEAASEIATGRIYSADDALRLGLIDRIGYMDDAVREAARISGLPRDASVVVYRRAEIHDDNLYYGGVSKAETPAINLVDPDLMGIVPPVQGGFYYLWLPGQSI